jgi:hypothetical protein
MDKSAFLTEIEPIVRSLATKIANGKYQEAVADCLASRLSAEDLRKAIDDYGRNFIEPPIDAYRNLDAVEVQISEAPTWSVWAPLWTAEERRSDLEMQLTIQLLDGRWQVEFDDLHVP